MLHVAAVETSAVAVDTTALSSLKPYIIISYQGPDIIETRRLQAASPSRPRQREQDQGTTKLFFHRGNALRRCAPHAQTQTTLREACVRRDYRWSVQTPAPVAYKSERPTPRCRTPGNKIHPSLQVQTPLLANVGGQASIEKSNTHSPLSMQLACTRGRERERESFVTLVVVCLLLLSLHGEGETVSTFPQAKFKVLPLTTSAGGGTRQCTTREGLGLVPGEFLPSSYPCRRRREKE